jgi:serine/threonine protein kinase
MFELQKYVIDINDYILGDLLGKGAYGEVYLATEKSTGAQVAVKFLFDVADLGEQRSFIREVSVPVRLDMPGIVKLIGFRFAEIPDPRTPHDDSTRARIVTEYMKHGTFASMTTDRHKGIVNPHFGPTEFSKVIFGVASVMAKVHQRKVIHRDLKAQNIFLDDHWEMKIADFGLSRVVSVGTQMTMSVGTPLYMAPELFNDDNHYDEKVDVYAYAIMLYQIFSAKVELTSGPARTSQQLMMRIMAGVRFVKPEGISEPFWELIQKCWDRSPAKRPSFAAITALMIKDPEKFVLPGTDMVKYKEYQKRINAEPLHPEMPEVEAFLSTAGLKTGGGLKISVLARTQLRYRAEVKKSMTRSMIGGRAYERMVRRWTFSRKPSSA